MIKTTPNPLKGAFVNRKERRERKGTAKPLRPLRSLRLKISRSLRLNKAPFRGLGVKAPFRGLGVVMAFLLASCSPAVNEHLASSTHTAAASRERDSVVVVVRDSTATRTVRDTVYVERWRTLWRDRTTVRTDTVVRTDTLRSAIVQRVSEPAPRGWWARFVSAVGYAALATAAVWLVGKARGIWGTRRR